MNYIRLAALRVPTSDRLGELRILCEKCVAHRIQVAHAVLVTTILILLGAVALGTATWLAVQVRRDLLRQRQATPAHRALDNHLSVAELRARCDADALPRYPRGQADSSTEAA